VIFAGLLFVTIYKMRERTQKDNDLAEESARMMVESERRSTEARRNYEQGIQNEREEAARKKLVYARAAITRAAAKSSADATADLNEAFVGYNAVIEVFPQDPDLRIERSRVHEARRNYDRAVEDLERAILLKKTLEPALRDKIDQLKLLIARKPAK
jgi:tetratricopeptide (TPR) repeat protein